MGASDWDYFVPYQSDINKALQELREQVFRNDRYYSPKPTRVINTDDPATMPEMVRKQLLYLMEHQIGVDDKGAHKPPTTKLPTTIEELIALNGEEGTHSILDIDTIASSPSFGVGAPLSKEELIQFFGTDQPTHAMIDEKKRELSRSLQKSLGRYKYEATYVIVYRDDMPDEIFFTGYSGD